MNITKLKNKIIQKFSDELPKDLTYHGTHHTLAVLKVCNDYIRRLSIKPHDAYLLRTAALVHDIGLLWTYNDHEEKGLEYIRTELPKWNYSKKDIERIGSMVLSTQIPQIPTNLLEEVLCDSDLDYLGTDRFYEIGDTLRVEFLNYGVIKNDQEWHELQIRFLENHSYHTDFAKKHREPVKQAYLQELKSK